MSVLKHIGTICFFFFAILITAGRAEILPTPGVPGVPGVPGLPGPGVGPVPGPIPGPVPGPGIGHPVPPVRPPVVTVPTVPDFKPGEPVGIIGGTKVTRIEPGHVVRHQTPSHRANELTKTHLKDAYSHATDFWKNHSEFTNKLNEERNDFYAHSSRAAQNQFNRVRGYYLNNYYRYFYSAWHKVGYVSGYYQPVRWVNNVYDYFHYPTVRWLYAKATDVDCYRGWYDKTYDQYPVEAFKLARVFLPTDTLRDLAMDMDGVDASITAKFRASMVVLGNELQAQISQHLVASFEWYEHDVVVNQYQQLDGKAVVVSGFVDRRNLHVPFQALISLDDSVETIVFVPTQNKPNDTDSAVLNRIHDYMKAAGVDPMTTNVEPTR